MRNRIHSENAEARYASCQDFRGIFEEDLHGLYHLAFLLTGDHQKAEGCFVTGLEDCVKESRVFREWARTWAKRVIVKSAIRELHPQSNRSNSSARVPIVFWPSCRSAIQADISTRTQFHGLATLSGSFLCCAFWSATGSTSALCFSAVQTPKFARPALRP